MANLIEGLPYPVYVESLTWYAENVKSETFRKNIIKSSIMTGGFAAFTTSEESFQTGREAYKDEPLMLKELETFKPGKSISATKEFIEYLNEDELSAILCHEFCHLDRDHHKNPGKQLGNSNIYFQMEHELQADRYASEQVSARAMHNAIIRIFVAQYELIERFSGKKIPISIEDHVRSAMLDDLMRPRLEALRAMM